MNNLLKLLVDGASDAGSLAHSIADSGLKSVSEVFQRVTIFGSLSAAETTEAVYDETHYLLVSLLGGQSRYAVYTKRILPPDIGVTNSLPKARIFHVPDESGKELLERELIANLVNERLDPSAGSSEFADLLEKVADQIDGETSRISGGLILIGGVVALANPILGVGIAVKGLLPSIGTMATKAGAGYVGNKLRDWSRSSAESKLRSEVSKEVQRLKPRIYPNPVLRSLEAIATNPETDFDPALDERNWIDRFESPHYHRVTAEAIHEVYQAEWKSIDQGAYQGFHLRWIRSFSDEFA